MSCPIGSYRRTAGLRLRPVPELRTCLVYVPRRARLCTLNVEAWLIFELAARETGTALLDAFRDASGLEPHSAGRRLQAGLAQLVDNGIIEPVVDGGERGMQ